MLTHPQLKQNMKTAPFGYVWLMLSGNKAHRRDDDMLVLSVWGDGCVHCMTRNFGPSSTQIYHDLDSFTGSHSDEVSHAPWKSQPMLIALQGNPTAAN